MNTIVHIIPHTHWDRAWYLPREKFLAGLPDLFETIFEFLKREDNPPFLLDGQTILIDDYLGLKPKKRDQIQGLVSSGRLSIGPFYVQADLQLSHPEALIRNLLIGMKDANELGGCARIGYFPDSWGIPRQLPQILADFGIPVAIFGRGYKEDLEKLGLEFLFIGEDGTQIPFVFMPKGYINGINLGYFGKWGDPSAQPFSMEQAATDIAQACAELEPVTPSAHLLVMNGGDHVWAEERLGAISDEAQRLYGINIDRGGVDSFIKAIGEAVSKLHPYSEELVYGRYSYMVHGVLSSRAYLKSAQARLSRRLVSVLEPLSSTLLFLGKPLDPSLLERVWKLLLQNLVHDEIGGCSIDEVHREMVWRYENIRQLMDAIQDRCALILGSFVALDPEYGTTQLIFNPAPVPLSGFHYVEFTVDKRYIDTSALTFYDDKGRPRGSQILGVRDVYSMRINTARSRTIVDAVVDLGIMKPYSYQVLRVKGIQAMKEADPSLVPASAFVSGETVVLQNGIIQLSFIEGTLSVLDLRNGVSYKNLLRITDEADIGDEYSYCSLPGHTSRVLPFIEPQMEILNTGPYLASFRLSSSVQIPLYFDRISAQRSKENAASTITLEFQLYAQSPDLHIRIRIDNRSRDHRIRLRVNLVGLETDRHYVGSHFSQREVLNDIVPMGDESWKEDFPSTRPFVSYLTIHDKKSGLVIWTDDSREYEFHKGPIIDFTLFRGIGEFSREDLSTRRGGAGFSFLTPDAQCLGLMDFSFGFHFSDTPEGCIGIKALEGAEKMATHPLAFDCTDVEGALPGEFNHPDMPESLPLKARNLVSAKAIPRAAFWLLSGTCIVSAVKPSEDGKGCIVRLYNVSEQVSQCRMHIDKTLVTRVFLTRSDEAIVSELDYQDDVIKYSIHGRGISTLLLQTQGDNAR